MAAKGSSGGEGAGRVDLHVHTDASDGIYAPGRVVELAKEAGLAAVAITDHDTFAGVGEALSRGEELGVEVIAGVELSAYAGKTAVHIVGLFTDPSDPASAPGVAKVESFRTYREGRMRRMIEKLAALGIEIEPEEVLAEAAGGAVGRPHLAGVLVKRGVVSDTDEAFARYLGNDGPVYVKKKDMTPEEAIRLVGELGGLAVFAHPGTSRLDERLGEFKEAGLAAVEVWHPKHKHADEKHYARLAKKRGLLVAGGSDFHGPGRSETPLGVPGIGYEVLEALRERHAAVARR